MDGEEFHTQVKCAVCDANDFDVRDGYYYCKECGTKAEELRDVEVDNENEFNDQKYAKKLKIAGPIAEKPELTSWECYNYILRGMVETLLTLGAKQNFKLYTLQVWAAFLRYLEVAFINEKYVDLPRLGACFLENDARAIYNYKKEVKKRKKRSDVLSMTSGESSARQWRKSKKKLDDSVFSQYSASSSYMNSASDSFTSASINVLKPSFSSKARRLMKMTTTTQKLNKDSKDINSLFSGVKPKKQKEIKYKQVQLSLVNMRHIYAILVIALNLAQDDLQLSDIVRLIDEKHIGSRNVANFFPENIVDNLQKIFDGVRFRYNPERYTYKGLQNQINIMLSALHINKLIMPDINKLASRYVTDLSLPQEIAVLVERLINLLPPEIKTSRKHLFPPYEARSMAYIVFVLKLLFGLDGEKEIHISKSAAQINNLIEKFDKSHSKLFVWNEWVQYIEMRKVIVSKHNLNFALQFKQDPSAELYFNESRRTMEEFHAEQKWQISSTNYILENFYQQQGTKDRSSCEPIVFLHSLTPTKSYFEQILLTLSKSGCENDDIPSFMHKDYSLFTVKPYLDASTLSDFLHSHQIELTISPIKCKNGTSVGVLHTPPNLFVHYKCNTKADFDIKMSEWKKLVKEKVDPMEFSIIDVEDTDKEVNKDTNSNQCGSSFNKNYNNDLDDCSSSEEEQQPIENAEEREIENECKKKVSLKVSAMDYWIFLCFVSKFTSNCVKKLEKELPLSLMWLLKTCSQTINMDWIVLYEQLLIIEAMFFYGIENLENFENCLYLKQNTNSIDLNYLLRKF